MIRRMIPRKCRKTVILGGHFYFVGEKNREKRPHGDIVVAGVCIKCNGSGVIVG